MGRFAFETIAKGTENILLQSKAWRLLVSFLQYFKVRIRKPSKGALHLGLPKSTCSKIYNAIEVS